MNHSALKAARKVLESSIINFRRKPVGTSAALRLHPKASLNYGECFVRDFFVSGMVFLQNGQAEIVKNFLKTVLEMRNQLGSQSGHDSLPGVMPASFRVERVNSGRPREKVVADFGDRAIGRVAPVDSMMWWTLLLSAYTRHTGDKSLAQEEQFQDGLRLVLGMFLRDSFEVYPTLLVPDGSFMIDRRMGVYGHPLEVQALFFGVLQAGLELLKVNPENRSLREIARKRLKSLRSYIRIFYWMDLRRLSEIHRFNTEEFGTGSVNMLNIYPESIPDWVQDWLPDHGGYLVGNLGPGRMDFRYFAQGNLLAILFGLTTPEQSEKIMALYDNRWEDLVGTMPLKILYPAMEGVQWKLMTGSDPKNVPWSYHNGGNWPVLLWSFTAAALFVGRRDMAERAVTMAADRLPEDRWPEYYDGRRARLIGRRANLNQVWSAAGFLFANQLLENPSLLSLFPR